MTGLEDLKLLRAFVRIAESGSISAAARAMNTSQPTISRQLRQLERAAGVVLVRRDTHTLNLTDAGLRLVDDARKLLNMAEAASQRLRDEKEDYRGHLRFVAVLDMGQWVIPRLLAAFQKRFPNVSVELHLINRPCKFIEEGFDCGLLVGKVTDTSIATRKVAELRRLLVASPALLEARGTPASPADLKFLPWMGILQPHFYSRDRVSLKRDEEQTVVRLSPVLLLDSVTALREAAVAGAGVTIQPEWLVSGDLAAGRLVRLLPGWEMAPAEAHVVFPTGRHLPGRLRALIDFLAIELPALIEELSSSKARGTSL